MYLIFCALNLMKMFWVNIQVMRPFGDLPFFFNALHVNVIAVFFFFRFFYASQDFKVGVGLFVLFPFAQKRSVILHVHGVCLFCFNLHKNDQ